jgi:hypothetical protein
VNNYGFGVEKRSASTSHSANWETRGFVEGYGSSNSPKEYSFTDCSTGGSEFKYRLKQIDFDGQFKYSPEVEVKLEVPAVFYLRQNYPNPFNPTTKIEFSIPSDNNVELKIFNVLGVEVAVLLKEHIPAGTYSVEFNATSASGGLPSGIYFYSIITEENISVKKMMLIK